MKLRIIIAVVILCICFGLCSLFSFKSNLNKSDFDTITVGESTFDDVLAIDDGAMHSTKMLSWGAVGYHRLNNGMYMVIFYYHYFHNETCEYIVQSKQIVFDKENANPIQYGVSYWKYYLAESGKVFLLVTGIIISIVILKSGMKKKNVQK